tara:strand:- start:425 stop:1117 length:693 start_codon:yes stop_codon:yes gene_type:complete
MVKENIAIIPAKGNSGGIPGKNLKKLNGKPLLALSIEAAKNAKGVDSIWVSTEDKRVAKIAEEYGAKIIWETSDKEYPYDLATESYLRFAVDEIEKEGIDIGLIVYIQSTSPFVTSKVVDECIEQVENEDYDSSITAYETFAYFGELKNGKYVPFRKVRKRRQEMKDPWYCDNGAVYVIGNDLFRKVKNRYGGKIGLVMMSEIDSLQLDEPWQWELTEKIFELKNNGKLP